MVLKYLRYVVGFCLGAVVVGCLYGCSPTSQANTRWIDQYAEETRTLKDGRQVTCLVLLSGTGYSIECDWPVKK